MQYNIFSVFQWSSVYGQHFPIPRASGLIGEIYLFIGAGSFDPKFFEAEPLADERLLPAVSENSGLVVMYVKSSSRDLASVNVMCDGKRLGGFSGYSLFGWDNPWMEAVMSEPEKLRRHIILETNKGRPPQILCKLHKQCIIKANEWRKTH